MLSEMFWVFQKKLIYKEKPGTVRNKECKKRYKKKSATRVFQVCISIVYDSFILELSISSAGKLAQISTKPRINCHKAVFGIVEKII